MTTHIRIAVAWLRWRFSQLRRRWTTRLFHRLTDARFRANGAEFRARLRLRAARGLPLNPTTRD